MKAAEDLRSDVQAELEWEPSLDGAGIGVAVHDGAVTLTGHVKSFAEKVSAEKAAKRVNGVIAVANDLEVHPTSAFKRDDTDIAGSVSSALRWNVNVPDDVQAVVKDAWVTLSGNVDWEYQRRAAANAVRGLRGVRGVSNDIIIRHRATPGEVKRKIEDAFKRSAQIDADHVKVTVVDGKATLSGSVRSWAERKEAEYAAWAAPGVNRVDNNLMIQPSMLAAI